MIPAGKYLAKITGATFGVSSNGNEQIAVQFEIADGDQAGQSIAYVGTFTDAAIEYTTEALRATGWEGDDLAEIPDLAVAGKLGPCEIVVQHETYEGKQRARIRFVNRVGGGRFKFKEGTELQGGELKSFAARMKSAFRGGAPSRSAPRSNGSASQPRGGGSAGHDDRRPPPPVDDDLPF
jgi:hypothetical protein